MSEASKNSGTEGRLYWSPGSPLSLLMCALPFAVAHAILRRQQVKARGVWTTHVQEEGAIVHNGSSKLAGEDSDANFCGALGRLDCGASDRERALEDNDVRGERGSSKIYFIPRSSVARAETWVGDDSAFGDDGSIAWTQGKGTTQVYPHHTRKGTLTNPQALIPAGNTEGNRAGDRHLLPPPANHDSDKTTQEDSCGF